MSDLKAIIGEKDYFVVTSNGECHFEMCGFDPEKIYEIEGNWLTMQCASGCHQKLYPVLDLVEKMASEEQDGKIPLELVPRCPECGGPMKIHMIGPNFIQPTAEKERLDTFLKKYQGKNLVILELGIGWRNQLIKAPLMRLTAQEPNAAYITINLGEVYITEDIKEKSFGVNGYLDETLAALKKEAESFVSAV